MVKNCGDHVHVQIAEKNILQDMTKIVKKKASFPFVSILCLSLRLGVQAFTLFIIDLFYGSGGIFVPVYS